MQRLLTIAVILSFVCCLPAAVASGGGNSGQIPDGETTRAKKKPAWVEDPTVGGTTKAVILTWAVGADRDTQRKARAEATEKLRTTFKLPATAKAKDMDTWTDEAGATFIHLVAR
ncbi:MAG: hypothetical protein J0M02_17615 [Planctomycetes bacterium]|nr:hypothetical protein [Planctomycetota bacterium]